MKIEEINYKIPKPQRTWNKQKKKEGYKINDYWWYENGIRRRCDTKWYLTPEECIKEAEARIKGVKDVSAKKNKRDLEGLIKEYMKYIPTISLDEIAPSTKMNRYTNCKALLKHTPKEMLETKISVFDAEFIEEWLVYLQTKAKAKNGKNISYEYFHSLKNTCSLIIEFAKKEGYFKNANDRYNSILYYIQTKQRQRTAERKAHSKNKPFNFMTYDEFQRFAVTCLYDLKTDDEKELSWYAMMTFNPHPQTFNNTEVSYENFKYFVYFCCSYFLGTRTEECRVLTTDDLHFDMGKHEGRVSINKALTSQYFEEDEEEYLKRKSTKTEGSERFIPIHPMLKLILKNYLWYRKQNNIDSKVLFDGEDNGYLSYYQIDEKIKKVKRNCGMKDKAFSKHDFRRSCAMYLCYEMEIPKEKVISYFGWVDTDMLDKVYSYFDRIQTADMLEKELSKSDYYNHKVPIFKVENGEYKFFTEAKKQNPYREHYLQQQLKAKEEKSTKK